ncbi:hypothetical protein P3S68_019828 [Capsicum galapagoense]
MVNLGRFPCVKAKSLEYLNLEKCFRLEKFPEILRRMNPKLKIKMRDSWIRELSLFIIQQYQSCGTDLDLNSMDNLVALPSSIYKLKGLVKLNVSFCSKLESFPEKIGDLRLLKELNASFTLISQLPPSIVLSKKLKLLNLGYCNLIDGGLPEDIGCLYSLKELYLR